MAITSRGLKVSTGLIKLPIQKGKAPPQGFNSVQFHELALIDSGLPLSSWHQSISCAACVECNTATGSAGCEPTSTCSPHIPSPCRDHFERRIMLACSMTHTYTHTHTSMYTHGTPQPISYQPVNELTSCFNMSGQLKVDLIVVPPPVSSFTHEQVTGIIILIKIP